MASCPVPGRRLPRVAVPRRRYRRADGDGRHSTALPPFSHRTAVRPRGRTAPSHACRVLDYRAGSPGRRRVSRFKTGSAGRPCPVAGGSRSRSSGRRSSPRGTRRTCSRSSTGGGNPASRGRRSTETAVDRAPDEFVRVVRVGATDSIASSLRVSRSIESANSSSKSPYAASISSGSSSRLIAEDVSASGTTCDSSGTRTSETQVSTIITYDRLYHGLNITTGSGQLPKDSDQVMTGGGDETPRPVNRWAANGLPVVAEQELHGEFAVVWQ